MADTTSSTNPPQSVTAALALMVEGLRELDVVATALCSALADRDTECARSLFGELPPRLPALIEAVEAADAALAREPAGVTPGFEGTLNMLGGQLEALARRFLGIAPSFGSRTAMAPHDLLRDAVPIEQDVRRLLLTAHGLLLELESPQGRDWNARQLEQPGPLASASMAPSWRAKVLEEVAAARAALPRVPTAADLADPQWPADLSRCLGGVEDALTAIERIAQKAEVADAD